MEISELKALSKEFRIQVLHLFKNAGSGHFGGSYSVVEHSDRPLLSGES